MHLWKSMMIMLWDIVQCCVENLLNLDRKLRVKLICHIDNIYKWWWRAYMIGDRPSNCTFIYKHTLYDAQYHTQFTIQLLYNNKKIKKKNYQKTNNTSHNVYNNNNNEMRCNKCSMLWNFEYWSIIVLFLNDWALICLQCILSILQVSTCTHMYMPKVIYIIVEKYKNIGFLLWRLINE